MVQVVNRAQGPRMFQVKGPGGSVLAVTVNPGQSADLDLVSQDDPVLKGWIEADEVLVGSDAQKFMKRRQMPAAEITKRRAELLQELAALDAMGEPDPALLTPPAQFGSDGGPNQTATVDGRAGAPTPTQGDGTAEQKRSASGAATAGSATVVKPKA